MGLRHGRVLEMSETLREVPSDFRQTRPIGIPGRRVHHGNPAERRRRFPALRRIRSRRRGAGGEPAQRGRGEGNLYACMHLYASRDAYKKSPEKARKPLYIKEKIKFLSLVCIVCINIWGFLPFFRILYKGMMHTMHTRPGPPPERWNQAETGRKDVCIPGCIRMHTGRPECIHGPHRGSPRPGTHTVACHRTDGRRRDLKTEERHQEHSCPRRLIPAWA